MKTNVILAIATVFVFSCKKDAVESPITTSESLNTAEYSMLNPGNYWVYQRYQIDLTTGEKKNINRTDCLYVSNDTLIDGKVYQQLKGTWFSINFHRNIRIENNSLINPNDEIYFIPLVEESRILRKDESPQSRFWDSIVWSMEHVNTAIETPLGLFNSAYQYNAKYYFNPEIIIDPTYAIRNDTEYYVKNIGVVRYTSSYTSPIDVHMDLIRYHLE